MKKLCLLLITSFIMVFCLNTNVTANGTDTGSIAGQASPGDSWTSKKGLPFTIELGSVSFSNGGREGSTINWTEYSDCASRAVTLGSKIYVINSIGKVAEYDSALDIWTEKGEISALKKSQGFFKLVMLNNKIYIVGNNYSEILEYDPVTGKTVLKTKLLSRRIVGGVAAANGKIYVLGGIDMNKVKVLDKVEEYDPGTNKWTVKSNMRASANRVTVTALNGKLYILAFGKSAAMQLEEFDPVTNRWTQKAQLKAAWISPGLEAVNNKIYLLGEGKNLIEGSTTNKVEEYDPITDKWITKSRSIPASRRGISTTVLNRRIYVIGGYQLGFSEKETEYFTNVDEYTPPNN